MANQTPGDGFMGWLGRQIGYVKGAVKPKPAAGQQQGLPQGQGGSTGASAGGAATPQATASVPPVANASQTSAAPQQTAIVPQVVYRDEKVEEIEHPDRPGVVLRRTVIDEAIVDPQKATGGNG